MARRLAAAFLLAGICLLPACTQWRYSIGEPLPMAASEGVERGTGLGLVLSSLGPPQRVSGADNGYVLAWEHWMIDEDSLGFSLGALGADVLTIDWGAARTRGDFLLLTFNRQHQVTGSAFSRWDNVAGGGSSIQPMLGLVSVVDVDDLVRRLPHHHWGGSMLQPLPRAINHDSQLDAGQNGIQQRGTPTGIGQRSLEMD